MTWLTTGVQTVDKPDPMSLRCNQAVGSALKCDVSYDRFIWHITCGQSPPLCASASGHTDSPPGSPTHPRSHPHPPWLCWWREAWWRSWPGPGPGTRQTLHLVPVECYWTCVSPLERFPPPLERQSPVDRPTPWHTTCTACFSRFRFLGCNTDKRLVFSCLLLELVTLPLCLCQGWLSTRLSWRQD